MQRNIAYIAPILCWALSVASVSAQETERVCTMDNGSIKCERVSLLPAGPIGQCQKVAGSLYEPGANGIGVVFDKIDTETAFDACLAAVKQGDDVKSKYRLARAFLKNGDLDATIALLDSPSLHNFAPAVTALLVLDVARINQAGYDKTAAKRKLERAVSEGYLPALGLKGFFLEHGTLYQRDMTAAANAYQEVFDKGYRAYSSQLGALYETGSGVEVDLEKARKIYRIGAFHGDPRASYHHARMLVSSGAKSRAMYPYVMRAQAAGIKDTHGLMDRYKAKLKAENQARANARYQASLREIEQKRKERERRAARGREIANGVAVGIGILAILGGGNQSAPSSDAEYQARMRQLKRQSDELAGFGWMMTGQ